jgi:acetyl esterase/lipase
MLRIASLFVASLFCCTAARGEEPLPIWPDLAPGETTKLTGEKMPPREGEKPAITRVVKITQPTMTVHRPEKPNGAAIVILPGGGFSKVVPDLEGTEAAEYFNKHGVTAFVLSYRTTEDKQTPGWIKPRQDAERALSLVRSQAERYGLKKDRIGLLAFSAGGQTAARLLSGGEAKTYAPIDEVDKISHRPDFAILVYPWNMYDAKTDALAEGIAPPKSSSSPALPPTFIVHTDDDRSSSLGAVLFYAALKKQGVSAELHVYFNGGHGYGLRPVAKSQISTWPDHAAFWLENKVLAAPAR